MGAENLPPSRALAGGGVGVVVLRSLSTGYIVRVQRKWREIIRMGAPPGPRTYPRIGPHTHHAAESPIGLLQRPQQAQGLLRLASDVALIPESCVLGPASAVEGHKITFCRLDGFSEVTSCFVDGDDRFRRRFQSLPHSWNFPTFDHGQSLLLLLGFRLSNMVNFEPHSGRSLRKR